MQLGIGIGLNLSGGGQKPPPPNTLIAGRGFFVLNGDTMTPAYSFGADLGSFTLTGVAASFAQGTLPILTAGTGVFTLTGIAAGLVGANTLAAQPASFVETGIAAVLNISMPAAKGTFTLTGIAATLTAPSAYTGPGDVASGAAAWWGLRAYNAAAIGGNCVDIVRASDSATQTFVTLADGSVDLASIVTFLTATTGKISKLYDQTGNGNHILQSTSAQRPSLTLNAVGSLPGMTFSNQQLISTTTYTHAQPLTLFAAAKSNGGSALMVIVGTDGGAGSGGVILASDQTATLAEIDAGSNLFFFSLTPSTFYGYGGMVNGGSSSVVWDGTNTNSGSAGTNAPNSSHFVMGYDGGNIGNALDGVVLEGGLWPSDKSANFAAMNTNQKTFWGYP